MPADCWGCDARSTLRVDKSRREQPSGRRAMRDGHASPRDELRLVRGRAPELPRPMREPRCAKQQLARQRGWKQEIRHTGFFQSAKSLVNMLV